MTYLEILDSIGKEEVALEHDWMSRYYWKPWGTTIGMDWSSKKGIEMDDTIACLYDGGWRPEDLELFIEEYNLDRDEAELMMARMQEGIDKGWLI